MWVTQIELIPNVATATYQPFVMQVPEGAGLGVEVDEEAVERFRVSRDVMEALPEGERYDRPEPRIICSTVYPDGSRIHLAPMHQGYGYFSQGHGPAHMPGVRLESWHDDGTQEWADIFERAKKHPVRDSIA